MNKIPLALAPAPAPVLALVAAVMLAAAVGCGGSGGAAAPRDAGRDLGQDLDIDTGACPARPDLVAASPACDTVVNSAAAVPFTPVTGTAPAPAGGAIADGLYESTKAAAYGTTTGGGRRITFVIYGGATRMLWAGEVLDATGSTVTTSFRADTSISVVGTQIDLVTNCVSTTPSPIPAALDFTVSGADLVLSLASGATVAATTYTRRGCAP